VPILRNIYFQSFQVMRSVCYKLLVPVLLLTSSSWVVPGKAIGCNQYTRHGGGCTLTEALNGEEICCATVNRRGRGHNTWVTCLRDPNNYPVWRLSKLQCPGNMVCAPAPGFPGKVHCAVDIGELPEPDPKGGSGSPNVPPEIVCS